MERVGQLTQFIYIVMQQGLSSGDLAGLLGNGFWV